MRRSIAGTAASLVTLLAIGAPLVSPAHAAPTILHCGSGATAAECELLDDLAAQLGPIAPLLGTTVAPLAAEAQDLAARSDSGAGVPTTEVVDVSEALLGAFGALPAPVRTLIGDARLGEVTGTLDALVDVLTAPAADGQQSSAGPTATPSKATSSSTASSFGSARSSDSSSAAGPSSTGGATSADSVPAVPVGDPLTLAPLGLPEFGELFAPAASVEVAAPSADAAQLAALDAALAADEGSAAEVVVVGLVSLLLLVSAGIAQLQANRHQIPA